MITEKSLEPGDIPQLADSLAKDEFHKDTPPEFFTENGTVCTVYSDEDGPICYVRGSKSLRLELLFTDNSTVERNLTALENGVSGIAEKARANGFKEVIVHTDSPSLKVIATERYGFVESEGELVYGL